MIVIIEDASPGRRAPYNPRVQLVITPEESGRLDAASPVPVETLMDRAGLGVALAAVEMGARYGSRVAVLAGTGNNGGDGWVAARYLSRRGAQVRVYSLGFPRGDYSPARKAAVDAYAAGVGVRSLDAVEPADLLIDALFGVGFRGTLPAAAVKWLDHPAPLLAVDVPSGLNALTGADDGPSFTARRTVTFHALKPGHLVGAGPGRCGTVSVVDIGLVGGTPELRLCEDADAPRPARSPSAHKWSAGSVAVVGGAAGMTGAALLAAQAAVAFGAGSVSVVCPGAAQPVYATAAPGLLTKGVGRTAAFPAGSARLIVDYLERFDVAIVGPGLGEVPPGFVEEILELRAGPVVLDADGLNALDGLEPLIDRAAPTVITPHAGEFRRLTGEPATYHAAAELPDKAGVVVLLKGNPTFVVGADRWVVTSGGAELATIGTGDVLAGMIGALWARGLDGETAARSAAHWHGTAGAALAAGGTVTAETLAGAVGRWAW
jgi:NAD(P)H-hydrate epimerase